MEREDIMQAISGSVIAPARRVVAIRPDDTGFLRAPTRAIYIGVGGDISLVPIENEDGEAVTFRNVVGGTILTVQTSKINQTGTTATDILGLL